MASKPKPVRLSVVRRGKTHVYELSDKLDWSVLFESTVLEIKASDGAHYFWPLDSVTLWKVEPLSALSGHA